MTERHKELEEKWNNRKSNSKEKIKWKKNLNPPSIIKKGITNFHPREIRKVKKLDVIIVSVNYNDLLAVSLQYNSNNFDSITVVTSSQDILCQKICEKFGAKCIVTDCMFEDGSEFNKGKAINEGINSLENPDFILILDADIIVRNKIDLNQIYDDCLYTSERHICKSYKLFKEYLLGELTLEEVSNLEGDKGLGFFQLFNINHNSIDKRSVYPENSTDASWDDLVFRDKFPKREIINNTIIHLGDPYVNWKGRKSNRFLKDNEIVEILTKKPTFTICSYYFNFNDNPKQKENLKKFIEQFKDFENNLIIAIPEDLKLNIKCNTLKVSGVTSDIWSKEILINRVIESIDTEYILWIDNDIIYENLEWLNNLEQIVKNKDFIQLYSKINYLEKNNKSITETHQSILSQENPEDVDKLLGLGFKPGGSWLGKVDILKSKKLFDKMYVGGGDTIFTYGLFGIENGWTLEQVKKYNYEIHEQALNWIRNFGKYRIGFLDVTVNHLFHGELKDRNYNSRYEKLKNYLSVKEEKNVELINTNEGEKIVVYTCISGNYDTLKEVVSPEPNIKYICFTDQAIQSSTWEIRPIPKYLDYLEQTKRARCLKILPNLFLKEFDISVWVDGSIEVKGNINKFISENLKNYFSICKHPDRVCTYQEAKSIIELGKDLSENVLKQVDIYKNLGFPENFGMVQSGLIVRRHNHDTCKSISINWWNELLRWSKRDQLSFNFSIWKKDVEIDIMRPSMIVSDYFQIYTHSHKGIEKVRLRRGYDSLKNYINNKEV